MQALREASLFLLLVYMSAESLIKTDNAKSLQQAEMTIDRITQGKLEETHPNLFFAILTTLSLIGVFAPVAIYLRKYFILLLCYLLVTK